MLNRNMFIQKPNANIDDRQTYDGYQICANVEKPTSGDFGT